MYYRQFLSDWSGQSPLSAELITSRPRIFLGDIRVMSENWLKSYPDITGGDFNDDGTVDFLDFADFALAWQIE